MFACIPHVAGRLVKFDPILLPSSSVFMVDTKRTLKHAHADFRPAALLSYGFVDALAVLLRCACQLMKPFSLVEVECAAHIDCFIVHEQFVEVDERHVR